jgi:hypothetical protein
LHTALFHFINQWITIKLLFSKKFVFHQANLENFACSEKNNSYLLIISNIYNAQATITQTFSNMPFPGSRESVVKKCCEEIFISFANSAAYTD